MTFFTQTVGITVTRVQRYFAANQLIASFDYDDGTTSFYYDGNGNLIGQLPPGSSTFHWYNYNQRNLLTSQGYGQLAENITLASFGYDGAGHRLTQADHTTPGGPTTTTYTNDTLGLPQVLVANNSITQTHHLFGLDLISQDNGTQTRTLLTDGLGSVRTELVGGTVQTVTTYDPYGTPLSQTGNSGTVYGFTGEQFDSTTGLLYLRARYYNPDLHLFMTKDPWAGNGQHPNTLHGYVYGYNSPPNFNDPSGHDPVWCAAEEYRTPSKECFPYSLVEFGGAATEQWTAPEKWQINKAAGRIGQRLATVYNEYMNGIVLPDYLYNMYYGFCGTNDRPLTAREAFIYFYGKPVLFYKTGTVNNPLSYGNYGSTPNGVGINVYLYPASESAYLADPANYDPAKLAYRFASENAGYRWATHELGHYFEARVNNIMGSNYIRDMLGDDTAIPRRGWDNDERSYGFAGTLYGWQQSPEATTGEEFADMFLGWNYNQWAPLSDEDFYVGQLRANFMDHYMAPWIALVINRERQIRQ